MAIIRNCILVNMRFGKNEMIMLWYDLHLEVLYNGKYSQNKNNLVLVNLIGGFLYEDEKTLATLMSGIIARARQV